MTFLSARSRAGARGGVSALRLPVAAMGPFALACLVAGCGNSTYYYGTPVVTMHTSKAGFTSFKVPIYSMYLTRNDGLTASLLGGAYEEQMDQAQLSDVPELVAAPAVPTGQYTSLTVTLDVGTSYLPYIYVDINGTSTLVAYTSTNLLNTAGNTVAGTYVTYTVLFDSKKPFVINHQQSMRIDLDLDLEASTLVDKTLVDSDGNPNPTLWLTPVLTPDLAPVDTKPLRARGLMVVVQKDQSSFIMNMHPFIDQYYSLGAMTVQTTAQTYFNSNGVTYTGADGLAALAALPINGNVAVYGTLADVTNVGVTPIINATTVIGGTSLENSLQGRIQGTVSARSGNTITVHGATYQPNSYYISAAGCYPQFVNDMSVLLDSSTLVAQDGTASSSLTPAAISVGQKIDIGGQPVDADGALIVDCTAPSSFDATLTRGTEAYPTAPLPGLVRLLPTPATGALVSAASGTASVNVTELGGFAPSVLDFTGTGSQAASYVLNTTDLSGLTAGTAVTAVGFPSAFGNAPPDFNATQAEAVPATEQQMIIEWWPAGTGSTDYVRTGNPQPFTNVTSTGATNAADTTLTLDGTSTLLSRHVIQRPGLADLDLDTLTAYPALATTDGTTLFTVGNASTGVYALSTLADFETEVGKLMATSTSTTTLRFTKLVAKGAYDAGTNTFNATRVTLTVQ